MTDTNGGDSDMSECDDIDLATLASMLDEDDMSGPDGESESASQGETSGASNTSTLQHDKTSGASNPSSLQHNKTSGASNPSSLQHNKTSRASNPSTLQHNKTSRVSNPSTMAELGLVLSDDDDDQPTSSTSKSLSSFSAAFSQSKLSKKEPNKASDNATEGDDPAEIELRELQARMKILQENLAKKKKLQPDQSNKFIKLTSTPNQTPKTSSRTLSAKEESDLYKRLRNKSELRSGDTDSEDEEDKRNPMEQYYNDCGREIKQRIAHETKNVQRERIEKSVVNKKTNAVVKPGWKATEGSLVNIARAGVSASQDQDKNVTLDAFSGIRIINPLVSQEAMRERMQGRRMVRLSTIRLHLRNGEIEGDWATIAVLVNKGNVKVSQKGSQYCIWKISDLSDCTKTAALFLFGSAYKALWKESVGTVFGILNPNIMKDKHSEGFSDMISLSIFEGQRVMMMGMSKDLGWCKGTTKSNQPCRVFVNKASCEFCVYHIQREYQKTSSRRADLQSSFTRVDPKRRLQERVLGKDQVFYGGQLYTSPSPSSAPKQARANKNKDLTTLNSLKTKMMAEELKVKDKLNIPKHLSKEEASAVHEVFRKNESLGEKLLAPTPGARNLLKHMVKEDTTKKVASGAIRSVSAKELLAMTHQSMMARRKQQEQNMNAKSSSSPGSRPPLPPDWKSQQPQLARGVKPGEPVNLDFSYSSPTQYNRSKARAVALVKRKGGIHAAEPNAVKNKDKAALQDFQNKVHKRLNTSSEEDDAFVTPSAGKKSKLTEAVENGKSRANLGAVDINSDKFKAMMEKKSHHSNLVDVVENEAMDKYYKGLEKKEMLEEKLSSVTELSVSAYVCFKCKYVSEKASELCKEENHELKTVKAKKRFFECKNCKQRTSSLDKLPRKACGNCGQESWCRVPMGKIKKGPKLDSEILSLRGDELNHYSASSSQVYLHI